MLTWDTVVHIKCSSSYEGILEKMDYNLL